MADEENEQNPWTRPGFVAAAVVVAIVVVLGIVLAVVTATRDDEDPETSPTPSETRTAPTAEPTAAAGGASVCGLNGVETTGTLSTAPAAEWAFQGTTAYPTSKEYGPGESTADGVRYCFQHSPEGAVFAAANAVVQGSDAATSGKWIEYFLSDRAPSRDQLLSDVAAGSSSSNRLNVAGFRLLAYGSDAARVDVAVRAVGQGNTVLASAVYDLVWEAGDWKLLPQDVTNPLRLAQLPDLAGYITWGSGS